MARKKPRRRTPGEGSIYWRKDFQKWEAMIASRFTAYCRGPEARPTNAVNRNRDRRTAVWHVEPAVPVKHHADTKTAGEPE